MKSNQQGFTLLELVLIMAILAIMSTLGLGYYRNYVKVVELNSTARRIISDLRNVQGKSMTGTDDRKWGIHFVNGTSDYYELFSTPTTYVDATASISETVHLPGVITFSLPGESTSRDVIFSKITGTTTAASVSLTFESTTRTIMITGAGVIY